MEVYFWGAEMAQWWERSPPPNESRVRFPDPALYGGLSLLLALFLAPRGFSSGTPVFPSPQKPTFPNSNSILQCAGISNDVFWTPWVNKLHFFYYSSSRAQTSGGSLRTPAPGPSLVTSNSTSRKTPSSRRTPHISSVTPGMPPSSVVVGKL